MGTERLRASLVQCGTRAAEVKCLDGDADHGEQLEPYVAWMKHEPEPCKLGVLVTAEQRRTCPRGFPVRPWREIAWELRRLSCEFRDANRWCTAAMTLDGRKIKPHDSESGWQGVDATNLLHGACLPIGDWGKLYCYLWWRYDDDTEEPVLSAVASIEPAKAETRDQWEQALKSVHARVRRERGEWELWIERILTDTPEGHRLQTRRLSRPHAGREVDAG